MPFCFSVSVFPPSKAWSGLYRGLNLQTELPLTCQKQHINSATESLNLRTPPAGCNSGMHQIAITVDKKTFSQSSFIWDSFKTAEGLEQALGHDIFYTKS